MNTLKIKKPGKSFKQEVVLPQWLYRYLVNKKVVAIDPEYLDLKPLEKRLYQIAKFYCRNDSLNNTFKLEYFAKKVGSSEALRNFRSKVKKIKKNSLFLIFLLITTKKKTKSGLHYANKKNKSKIKKNNTNKNQNQKKK